MLSLKLMSEMTINLTAILQDSYFEKKRMISGPCKNNSITQWNGVKEAKREEYYYKVRLIPYMALKGFLKLA